MIISFSLLLLDIGVRALFKKKVCRQGNYRSFQGTKNVLQNISYVRGQ